MFFWEMSPTEVKESAFERCSRAALMLARALLTRDTSWLLMSSNSVPLMTVLYTGHWARCSLSSGSRQKWQAVSVYALGHHLELLGLRKLHRHRHGLAQV